MRDPAWRGGGLDLVVLLEAFQSVAEAYASAEQDRDHHSVQVVDEPDGKELSRTWRKWNVVPPSISIDGRV